MALSFLLLIFFPPSASFFFLSPPFSYTKPEEVYQVYEALSKVPNGAFSVAAAFGNVHGVYAPGNVRLDPEILGNS